MDAVEGEVLSSGLDSMSVCEKAIGNDGKPVVGSS